MDMYITAAQSLSLPYSLVHATPASSTLTSLPADAWPQVCLHSGAAMECAEECLFVSACGLSRIALFVSCPSVFWKWIPVFSEIFLYSLFSVVLSASISSFFFDPAVFYNAVKVFCGQCDAMFITEVVKAGIMNRIYWKRILSSVQILYVPRCTRCELQKNQHKKQCLYFPPEWRFQGRRR